MTHCIQLNCLHFGIVPQPCSCNSVWLLASFCDRCCSCSCTGSRFSIAPHIAHDAERSETQGSSPETRPTKPDSVVAVLAHCLCGKKRATLLAGQKEKNKQIKGKPKRQCMLTDSFQCQMVYAFDCSWQS